MKIVGTCWTPGGTYFYIECPCGMMLMPNMKRNVIICPDCKGKQEIKNMEIITLEERNEAKKEV